MSIPKTLTGCCQCESVRYRINGEPKMLYLCHCLDCQKQSSSAFGMSLIIDQSEFELVEGESDLKIWSTVADSGAVKNCAFCGNCGSRIYHGFPDGGKCSIKAGTLDNAHDFKPVSHIWTSSAMPWMKLEDGRTICVEKGPGPEHELERRWKEDPFFH